MPWSSGTPGIHIIRAVIDASNRVAESNELNNEATRAIVAGQSANLKFGLFTTSNAYPALNEPVTLEAGITNNGDVACAAEVWFGFVTAGGDTAWIRQMPIEVSPAQTIQVQVPWFVTNTVTTLVAAIKNSSVLEFTYDDNTAFTYIGQFTVAARQVAAACTGLSNGVLQAVVKGGTAPYTYRWSNGGVADTLMARAGNYSLTVTDAEGRVAGITATLAAATPLTYYRDADGDGYGQYADLVQNCGGAPVGFVANALDCDDNNPLIGPAPVFVMDTDIEIQGNLDLKNPQRPDLFPCWNGGKLVLNGKSLVVKGTITGFDLNHFIVTDGGSCLKIINTQPENTFPIGVSASSPNFVKIANSGTPDAFCVGVKEAVLTDGTGGDTIRTSVVNRTWDIEETVQGGSNATITMYWSVQDEAPGFNRNLSAAAHYHQGFWETGPVGSAQAEAGGQFSRTQQGFTSFSPFAVTSGGNAILPVKLIRFDAKATPAGAELEWNVAQVTGTVNFEVHRSADGMRFEQIGVVPARQNGQYRFTDAQKEPGTVYYRLKITDLNGRFEWGPVRKVVHHTPAVTASLYPNPVQQEAMVLIQGLKRVATIRLTITDMQGRVITTQQAGWNEAGTYRLKTSQLATGQYLIKVDTGAETLILKMVKA
ncbi:MAG: T9SS type A sorting domain-containing protein, partial [Chitinophagaceae bacterium]|nr:T9SS type A sorting domain-containing protein [Chitinophagaceae bacterium]